MDVIFAKHLRLPEVLSDYETHPQGSQHMQMCLNKKKRKYFVLATRETFVLP